MWWTIILVILAIIFLGLYFDLSPRQRTIMFVIALSQGNYRRARRYTLLSEAELRKLSLRPVTFIKHNKIFFKSKHEAVFVASGMGQKVSKIKCGLAKRGLFWYVSWIDIIQ